jgi:hypothetical protein
MLIFENTIKSEASRKTYLYHLNKFMTFFNVKDYDGLALLSRKTTDYVATWHIGANSERGITCKYPQVIQYSFGHDFGI